MMPILMFDLLEGIIGESGNEGLSVPGLNFDTKSDDKFISNQLPSIIQMGYGSSKTIMNLKTVSIVISTIIIRVIISGFLKLIYKIGKFKCAKKWYKKITGGLYFSSVIGLTLESYLEFLISIWFTLTQPVYGNIGDIVSFFISCLIAFLALIFVPVSSIWMIF